ncbi:TPA: hypothetical protein DEG21_01520 [Patescibacteria group bacterium]|nr:hypothetical protein [Candidatus Gracilibacteria bacterium]HBY74569.1 hypothetical protein [Candidatus Gracilibacteria bacterium]
MSSSTPISLTSVVSAFALSFKEAICLLIPSISDILPFLISACVFNKVSSFETASVKISFGFSLDFGVLSKLKNSELAELSAITAVSWITSGITSGVTSSSSTLGSISS